jgi:signal transduction histidine kinase
VKFAGAGAEVVVTVDRQDPAWVDVHVVDDGPGMPAADLARAAEPFWSASPSPTRW